MVIFERSNPQELYNGIQELYLVAGMTPSIALKHLNCYVNL